MAAQGEAPSDRKDSQAPSLGGVDHRPVHLGTNTRLFALSAAGRQRVCALPAKRNMGQTAAGLVAVRVIPLVYTVIPDIHADPDRLERSLAACDGSGRVAFLGDFIDAGRGVPRLDDAAVLGVVRGLVAAGRAVAVMGNHELNAVLFHRTGKDGVSLRSRGEKNLAQHRSFVDRFGVGTPAALDWMRWFLTLPLWLDIGGLRLVHACWDADAIGIIAARRADGRLQAGDLAEVAVRKTPFAQAVNRLLTGPEVALPDGLRIADFAGHLRGEVRLAWWRREARTWREATVSVPGPAVLPKALPRGALPFPAGDGSGTPVLFGHYKLQGQPVIGQAEATCLDDPDAPCVYLWRGEARLRPDALVQV